MISQNFLFKIVLASVVLTSMGIGLWAASAPAVAVSKSPVPAHKCCSTWEDHMRASGVDDEVGKAFDLKPLLADAENGYGWRETDAVIRH